MAYDLEKYRDKREKVLGVRKKGISFGVWAATVSAIIIVGLISMVAPKSIAISLPGTWMTLSINCPVISPGHRMSYTALQP